MPAARSTHTGKGLWIPLELVALADDLHAELDIVGRLHLDRQSEAIEELRAKLLAARDPEDGEPAKITGAPLDPELAERYGVLPELHPLPTWGSVRPGDVFRVFEDGGRNNGVHEHTARRRLTG